MKKLEGVEWVFIVIALFLFLIYNDVYMNVYRNNSWLCMLQMAILFLGAVFLCQKEAKSIVVSRIFLFLFCFINVLLLIKLIG